MAFNIADFPAALEPPKFLTHNSAWMYHMPMAPVFVALLRPRTFVELGTYRGDSYLMFCQAVAALGTGTRCTAVDTWAGDAHAGFYGPGVLKDLRHAHDPQYAGFSRLLQATFDAALPEFANGSVDLLHIDGLHTYEGVRHDFETWLPKLSPRGVVLFHDTAIRERDFGVWKLWEEVTPGRPHFEVPYGCGLGILAVGTEVPPAFLAFLADLNAAPEQTLAPFKALGFRNELMRRGMFLANAVHRCQEMVNEWRKHTAQPIRNPTPNMAKAWEDPPPFCDAAVKDVGALTADALQLLLEITDLRKKVAAKPPAAPAAPAGLAFKL